MTNAIIRQKLHQFIDNLEEKKAEAIYTLFENEINYISTEYTSEHYNKELDDAEAEYQRGEFVTHEQVRKESEKW